MVKYGGNMPSTKHPAFPICLGADHAGFWLKEALKAYLISLGYDVVDFGTDSETACDYPDFIIPAARAAVQLKGRAIFCGGSGTGECIAANKVRGLRCALPYDAYTARLAREHNDANAISLGTRTVTGDLKLAKRLVKIWLDTPFSGEARHVRRLKKIANFEKRASSL
jgi:ribose 5-phosphate isomerase B